MWEEEEQLKCEEVTEERMDAEERHRKDERGTRLSPYLLYRVVYCRSLSLPASLLPFGRQAALGHLCLFLFASSIQPDPSVTVSPSTRALIFHFSPHPPVMGLEGLAVPCSLPTWG